MLVQIKVIGALNKRIKDTYRLVCPQTMKKKEKREDQFWSAVSIIECSFRAPFFPNGYTNPMLMRPEGGEGWGVPIMNGLCRLVNFTLYTNLSRTLAIFTGCVPISPENCYFLIGWRLDLDFLKLILFNNSSNLNKENHKHDGGLET